MKSPKDYTPFPLSGLAETINEIAAAHGFWDKERNFGEMIALMHSELSEALEEHRDGKPAFYYSALRDGVWMRTDEVGIDGELHYEGTPWKVPDGANLKPEGAIVELADCIIRCLDTMHHLVMTEESLDNFTIDDIVQMKVDYNRSRPMKHGKEY